MKFNMKSPGYYLLGPVADFFHFRVDQINFVVCQFVALYIGFYMRKYLHHSNVSAQTRHMFSLVIGVALVFFCFGFEILHIVILSTVSYMMSRSIDPKYSHWFVMPFAFAYLSAMHIQKMVFQYGTYTLDVTGPLMIMVQRITALACSIHDGMAVSPAKLPEQRKKYAIWKHPSAMEYFGYLFQFQCVLAGPVIPFQEYDRFIRGKNFTDLGLTKDSEPSSIIPVIRKVCVGVACITLYLNLIPHYGMEIFRGDSVAKDWTVVQTMWYIHVSTFLTRCMYYHAWQIADAICNASGFGFRQFSDDGKSAVWDICTNVYIFSFESASNLRECISNWNLGTNTWLRHLVYYRAQRFQVLLTFVLSAFWHGFYPGYYITFVSAALLIQAAKIVRKYVRPHFLKRSSTSFVYHVLTIFATRLLMAYLTFPFILFDFWPVLLVYRNMYFFAHVASVMVFFLPPILPKIPLADEAQKKPL